MKDILDFYGTQSCRSASKRLANSSMSAGAPRLFSMCPGGEQQHNLGPGGEQQHNLGPGGEQHLLGPGGEEHMFGQNETNLQLEATNVSGA